MIAANVTGRAESAIIIHGTQYGTCTAGKSDKTLDYFMAFGGIERWTKKVSMFRGIGIKTHRPVGISCHAKAVAL